MPDAHRPARRRRRAVVRAGACPRCALSSDLVLYGLLPPLLYAAALSHLAARRQGPPAAPSSACRSASSSSPPSASGSSRGCSCRSRSPSPLALGAIVAPPDAVAATSVARRIGLPRRITTILEGESLLNDATALVTLRTALAAAGLVAHGAHSSSDGPVPEVTLVSVSTDLVVASVGGVAIGVLAYLVIGALRRHLTEVPADTALSFVAPYLAFVPAEQVGASGVLAVVTRACCSRTGHRSCRPRPPGCPSGSTGRASRSSSRTPSSSSSASRSRRCSTTSATTTRLSRPHAPRRASRCSSTCLVLRPVWMIPFASLTCTPSSRPGGPPPGCARRLVGRDARRRDPRGGAHPARPETPLRAELVVIAARRHRRHPAAPGHDAALARPRPRRARSRPPRGRARRRPPSSGRRPGPGLRLIESDPEADLAAVAAIREQASARVNRSWERLGTLGPGDDETPSEAQARLRTVMIREERAELLRIRDERRRRPRGAQHRARPARRRGDRPRLERHAQRRGAGLATAPAGPDRRRVRPPRRRGGPDAPDLCRGLPDLPGRGAALGAPAGVRDVRRGRLLRLLAGPATPRRTSTTTGHPVMRSIEPGEAWRWCYVDEVARLGPRHPGSAPPALGLAVCRRPAPRCSSPPPPRPVVARCAPPASSRSCACRRSTRTPSSRRPRTVHGAARGSRRRPAARPGQGRGRRRRGRGGRHGGRRGRRSRPRLRLRARARRRGARQAGRRRRGHRPLAPDARPLRRAAHRALARRPARRPTTAAPAAWWAARHPRRCTSPTSTTPRSRPTSPPASRCASPARSPSTGSAARTSRASRATRATSSGSRCPLLRDLLARARRRLARPAHAHRLTADPARSTGVERRRNTPS